MWPSRIQNARGFNNSSLKFFKKEKEKGRKVQKHQEQVLPPRVQLRNLAYQSFRALASLYKFHLEIITKATRKRMVLLNIVLSRSGKFPVFSFLHFSAIRFIWILRKFDDQGFLRFHFFTTTQRIPLLQMGLWDSIFDWLRR